MTKGYVPLWVTTVLEKIRKKGKKGWEQNYQWTLGRSRLLNAISWLHKCHIAENNEY